MLSEDKSSSKIICESCGKEFSCGAKIGGCWCFEIEVTPEDLDELKKNFKNCLCVACLTKYNQKRINLK